ncbi:hypothetical protein BgiMline_031799, partial [Biomphalaria glabrata]
VSSDEYRKVLPQYRKSFSIYGKSNIRALYKALEPAIISFFKIKHLTKDYFLYSIRQRDPWTQSVLKGRFYRMDPNKDGVMNEKDLNGYFRFVMLSDMLVGGADANNDYTVTKKEFQQHVARLNPSQDKTLQVSFDIMFKDLDSNQDQLFNTNDFLACK